MIMKKTTRALLASFAVGVTCFAAGSIAARGGGGGHFGGGGGHFGGGGFGAGHFSGASHFLGVSHFGGVGPFVGRGFAGGSHVGTEHLGSGASGGAHIVSIGHAAPGHVDQPGVAHPVMRAMSARVYGPELGRHEFTRNGFGDSSGWHNWGGYHDGHWHRWHGWYGPVFWPFLYGDILSFSLFDDDNDLFWTYDSDAFQSTIYWPGPYGSGPSGTQILQSDTIVPSDASAACGALAPGVTDLPIEQLRQTVHPNAIQNMDLANLRSSTLSAKAVIDSACPSLVAVTPVERLDAMQQRLDATITAVEIVRGPLQTFYDSLSEGQKASLAQVTAPGMVTRRADSLVALCNPSASGFAELPLDNVEHTTQPIGRQVAAFEALKVASTNAASELAASCPATTPQTPVERMDAVAARLTAMSRAAEVLRPALTVFYAELTPYQRAQFDRPPPSTNAATLNLQPH
jgi:LTXXQ motif family protein